MANIHIKSESRKAHEAYVLNSFGKRGENVTKADREAAEIVAARTNEAYNKLKKMEVHQNG